MRNKGICVIGIVFLVFVASISVFYIQKEKQSVVKVSTERREEIEFISVDTLRFERFSKNEIGLFWEDNQDILVDTYIVKRRTVIGGTGKGEWQIIDTLKSDGMADGTEWSIIDALEEVTPQQFEYRVDVELAITEKNKKNSDEFTSEQLTIDEVGEEIIIVYEPKEGTAIFASNIKICIDPGHYDVVREVAEVDEYHYVEGNFVLELAQELRDTLKKNYGIDSCMTRDLGTITIDGYMDEELDSKHIALRGEYAAKEDCDLFVSLHTNSNEENANGYETFFQPISINKPIIILNTYGLEGEYAIKAANAIGMKLASSNYELGIADSDIFSEVVKEEIGEWTKEYNDGLGENGTVVIRRGKKDPDYYGVLRGATDVEVPGMIIEHGYHSVAEVRKAAAEGDLKEAWANADACGIAYGFGFTR